MSSTTAVRLSRRELLKLGLGASVALTTLGLAASLRGCSSPGPGANYRVLRDSDIPLITALIPALVGPHPALQANSGALQAAIDQLDLSLAWTSANLQHDVYELFDLISAPLTRGPMTGVWGAWENATPQNVEAFLLRWRDSRMDMFRQGYSALSQLLLMAWYATPASWEAAGYPGPPRI